MDLSDRQTSVAATAVTILGVVVILAAFGGLAWLAASFLRSFSHVFLPLAVAGVAALVFQPYYDWLRKKLKLPPALALLALFLSALVPLVAFGWFFGALIAGQVSELVAAVPAWWEGVREQARQRWPQVIEFLQSHPVGQRIVGAVEDQQETLLQGLQVVGGKALSAGFGVVRGAGVLLGWAVLPVYFMFFVTAPRKRADVLEGYLPFLKPETRKDAIFLVQEFINIIVAFFRGQLIIALIQGILFAIGFSLVGLPFGFILGLMLGFLNVIPYLGSIIGLGVAMPLAYFQDGGGLWLVGATLAVFTVVQLIEGYVLTPRIMGDRTGLHPVAIIVAVFFWGSALDGILGMILAIPLTAFLVVFWRLVREKYIGEWV